MNSPISGHTAWAFLRRLLRAAAAAPGSAASVIARTTTTRVAPAASTSSSRPKPIPPIANQGRAVPSARHVRQQPGPGARPPRLRRRRPHRPGAEVVDALLVRRRRGLLRAVAGPPDHRPGAEDPPGHGDRQVVLAEVQHVGPGGQGHVRPVVDREQRPVPGAGGGEHLEQRQFLARLEALLPQLDDVHPAGKHRVKERRQVPGRPPPVRAQVQPRVRQPRPQVSRHPTIVP